MDASLQAKLSRIIAGNLPGESAHVRLSPMSRQLSSIAKAESTSFRESAVAVVLFEPAGQTHPESAGQLKCILIQRPTYIGNHSGQVSFPGGKRDPEDENLEITAIRECKEEIGVDLRKAALLGRLTPVFIPVSGFHVEPYLFFLQGTPVFVRDEREVEAILTISLRELLLEESIQAMDIAVSEDIILKDVPYFNLSGKQIWGATALVLNELKEVLLQLGPEFKI
jgi:8-oxo-dGTP pyrophosphatase MutT (NUDIX family)